VVPVFFRSLGVTIISVLGWRKKTQANCVSFAFLAIPIQSDHDPIKAGPLLVHQLCNSEQLAEHDRLTTRPIFIHGPTLRVLELIFPITEKILFSMIQKIISSL
jgi:hypothetical protein